MKNKLFIAIVAVAIIAVGAWWFWSNQSVAPQENQEQNGSQESNPAEIGENYEEALAPATESEFEPVSEISSESVIATKISWEKDNGQRVTGGSVPFVHKLK